MKKTLPLYLLILLTACNDFLDTELEGQFTTDTFFQTQDHALSAINATYQIAAFNSTNNYLWVFGDLASDDTIKGGFADLRARIIAEAKFLRAYFYFHLSNIFGNIPLKTIPAFTPDELNVPKSSVDNIYAQIEQDLTEAATILPTSYESANIGRATKGSALGLLAKTYLFQEKWQLAFDAATQTEGLGYSLTNLYRDNFKVETENNSESVFEIQHLTNQIPATGTYLNQWFSPSVITGYFFNAPTQNFIDEFEVTQAAVADPRLDYSVGREGNLWVNNQVFDPLWSPTTYLSKKQVQDPGENPIGDGDLNYTFMRFSEILLIKAEALNELGSTSLALIPLNLVRKRARESYLFDTSLAGFGTIPENLLPEVSSTNASVVRDAIRHERRVELGLEFHRYFDIVRYGQTYAEQALSDTQFNYALHRYFPIPQSEIDTNTNL